MRLWQERENTPNYAEIYITDRLYLRVSKHNFQAGWEASLWLTTSHGMSHYEIVSFEFNTVDFEAAKDKARDWGIGYLASLADALKEDS